MDNQNNQLFYHIAKELSWKDAVEYQNAMKYLANYHQKRKEKWKKIEAKRLVYFAQDNDQIKIGCSISPEERIKEFQTARPFIQLILSCPGGHMLEHLLHKEFAPFKIAGEWFKDNPKLKSKIKELYQLHPTTLSDCGYRYLH